MLDGRARIFAAARLAPAGAARVALPEEAALLRVSPGAAEGSGLFAVVTKRRNTKVAKFQGGIPFTYGPLAHFLKNRLYTGDIGHSDKWFPGEHTAIVDRKTFDQVQQLLNQVQQLLKSKAAGRKARRSASQALLLGKLYGGSVRDNAEPRGPTLLQARSERRGG